MSNMLDFSLPDGEEEQNLGHEDYIAYEMGARHEAVNLPVSDMRAREDLVEMLPETRDAVTPDEDSDAPKNLYYMDKYDDEDEFLARRSVFRTFNIESRDMRKSRREHLIPDSAADRKACNEIRTIMLDRFVDALNNPDKERLPVPIVLGLRQFEQMKNQFANAPIVQGDLDMFGNFMVSKVEVINKVFNCGEYTETLLVSYIAAKNGYSWNEKVSLMVLLSGSSSSSKTYTYECVRDMMLNGTFDQVTHATSLAMTGAEDNDMRVSTKDEVSAAELGGGATRAMREENANSVKINIEKSMATDKRVRVKALVNGDNGRETQRQTTSAIGSGLKATNASLPDRQSAWMMRHWIRNVIRDPRLAEKVNAYKDSARKNFESELLELERLENFYLAFFECAIYSGAVVDVDMSAHVAYMQRYQDKMGARGSALTNAKHISKVFLVARTLTISYAIAIGLFSDIMSPDRLASNPGLEESPYVRFFESRELLHKMVRRVERMAVCTRSISIFAFSLCRDMFVSELNDSTSVTLSRFAMTDAQRAIFAQHFDAEKLENAKDVNGRAETVVVDHHAPAAPLVDYDADTDASASDSAKRKQQTFARPAKSKTVAFCSDAHPKFFTHRTQVHGASARVSVNYSYVEVVAARGDYVDMLAAKLRSVWSDSSKPSEGMIKSSLDELINTQMLFSEYELCSDGMVHRTERSFRGPGIRMVSNSAGIDGGEGIGNGVRRYFVAVDLLLTKASGDEMICNSLLETGFEYTYEGRVLTSMPYVDVVVRRSRNPKTGAVKTKRVTRRYASILRVITMKPTEEAFLFRNENPITRRAVRDISSLSNDPRFQQSVAVTRNVANSVQAVTIDSEPETLSMHNRLEQLCCESDLTLPLVLERAARAARKRHESNGGTIHYYPTDCVNEQRMFALQLNAGKGKVATHIPNASRGVHDKTKYVGYMLEFNTPHQMRLYLCGSNDLARRLAKECEGDVEAAIETAFDRRFLEPEVALAKFKAACPGWRQLFGVDRDESGNVVAFHLSAQFSKKRTRLFPSSDESQLQSVDDTPLSEMLLSRNIAANADGARVGNIDGGFSFVSASEVSSEDPLALARGVVARGGTTISPEFANGEFSDRIEAARQNVKLALMEIPADVQSTIDASDRFTLEPSAVAGASDAIAEIYEDGVAEDGNLRTLRDTDEASCYDESGNIYDNEGDTIHNSLFTLQQASRVRMQHYQGQQQHYQEQRQHYQGQQQQQPHQQSQAVNIRDSALARVYRTQKTQHDSRQSNARTLENSASNDQVYGVPPMRRRVDQPSAFNPGGDSRSPFEQFN